MRLVLPLGVLVDRGSARLGILEVGAVLVGLLAPGVLPTFRPPRRPLPLGLGRQPLIDPLGMELGIFPSDIDHRVVGLAACPATLSADP